MDGMLNRCEAVTHKVLAGLFVELLVFILCWTAAMGATERGGTLRIGMTAADIPYTGGQPDQGFEGFRFIGYQLYDPLVRWDLSQGEQLPAIVPGLAESCVPPVGANRMPYLNPEMDRLIEAAESEFDLDKQNQILAKAHEIIVDDAPWVFIVHDLNPRALSPKVKGFVQPQLWFVDLALPWMEK